MKVKIVIITYIVLLSYSVQLYSNVTWRHIDNLPCEEVSSVIQDSNGYIWIGTRLGLFRYDGYVLKNYRNNTSHPYAFSSSNIISLTSDDDAHIYAGSFFGLNKLSVKTDKTTYSHFEGRDLVTALLHDKEQKLWIGTDNGIYVMTDKHEPKLFTSIPRDYILHLSNNKKDVVVVTEHNGIYLINSKGQSKYVEDTKDLYPSAVFTDSRDNVWIGTRGHGLYRLRKNDKTHYPFYDGLTINDIRNSSEYDDILIGTDKGLYRHQKDRDILELHGMCVKSLFTDYRKNIWAASDTKGLYLLPYVDKQFNIKYCSFIEHTTPIMSQFSVRHLNDSLSWSHFNSINSIYESSNGDTYIGTNDNGFYITKNGKTERHINVKNTEWLKTNSIHAFRELDKNSTLVGTWYGLYIMGADGSGRQIEKIGKSDIRDIHILSINSLEKDDVWLGLVGGIAHIRGSVKPPGKSSITLYTHLNGKGANDVRSIIAATDKHNESGDYQLGGIYKIVKDKHQRIWACTSEPGLLLYDKENDCFRSVSEQMGILGDNVHSIDIDEYENFWMTTNHGILKMSIGTSLKDVRQQIFDRNDGLPTNYFGSSTSCVLNDSIICFMTPHNIITINTERIRGNAAKKRKTYLSEILINNRTSDESGVTYDNLPPYTRQITCAHDNNNISFELSTLDPGHETSVRYIYKLDGLDDDYRQTDMGNNIINYSHIPPGTYTLHYSSFSDDKEDQLRENTLTITILQPIWWCWWAKTIYILLLLTVTFVIVQFMLERKRKKNILAALETEKQQQQELYQKKMSFYTRVIHDFMTPLTLMNDMVHELQNKVSPNLQATLCMLGNQSDRLVETVNNIADMKEDESMQQALDKAQEMTQADKDFLRKCIESVNKHIDDVNYSHKILMDEVGASHATLYRKLKLLTGMDATSFIRETRMKAAYNILMTNPSIRVTELAERVGYDNTRYFSSCFKKTYGMNPRDFHTSKYNEGDVSV